MPARHEQLERGFRDGLINLKDLIEHLSPEEAYEYGYEAAYSALAPVAWSQAVGERLDTSEVTSLLRISRQALAKRVESASLLGLPGKQTTYYPSWQFDRSRRSIRPEVRAILRVFDSHGEADRYMIASWMMTPNPALNDAKPAEWLEGGKEVSQLLDAARQVAGRWDS
ncbi:antitoxin Xre/MbcA/ParS toxin-binding domain-containing protein [Nonomuraea roseoviolacea]|uniref:Antitoxin Xre/MbcA/ParS-like toxin-binding domain-containing protein n=1 Tax=Nonomuraea roseoviolacea subsp. carminata TaxID=160689 RepID=A0ABT1K093_9ACTN|nr:antitoxin Xre/MbcA/ParS toxin-binding domain-containing protein [Nonomuraea roseoviolacea]MCP2347082.1 hypothetical protein [Nonomuraea roseoviolacea subsp. carminata]